MIELAATRSGAQQSEPQSTDSDDARPSSWAQTANMANDAISVSARFEQLASRIEYFLGNQLQRVEKVLQLAESHRAAAAAVDQAATQLKEDRHTWEQQRQEEYEWIRKQRRRLVQAWDDLEREQQQILLARSSALESDRLGRCQSAMQDNLQTVGVPQPWGSVDANEQTANVGSIEDSIQTGPQLTNRERVPRPCEQFQELKREIRRHARRGQQGR